MTVYTARSAAAESQFPALYDSPRERTPPHTIAMLKVALARALRQNAHRAGIMATTGHDLRQPLHVLSMLVETLALKSRDADTAAHAALAQRAVRRIAEGLDGLARASVSQVDARGVQRQEFPIADVLSPLTATWQAHALEKNVRLRVVPSSAWVCSDRAMLTTILDNLVGNAIKYSPQRRVVVGCRRQCGLLSIRVVDQGIGIPQANLQRIFDAFHQEDSAADGMGLGLSIVRLTAEALGHRVGVASAVGRGSVFRIDVPLVRGAS